MHASGQQGFCKIRATEYRLKYICNSYRLLYLGRLNEKSYGQASSGNSNARTSQSPERCLQFFQDHNLSTVS